jgi:hypothetical protein
MSGEEVPLSLLLFVCSFVSYEEAPGFMKVKVRVEGRLQVTDCSDINILIQSISLGLVSANCEGEHSQYIFSNS